MNFPVVVPLFNAVLLPRIQPTTFDQIPVKSQLIDQLVARVSGLTAALFIPGRRFRGTLTRGGPKCLPAVVTCNSSAACPSCFSGIPSSGRGDEHPVFDERI